jgi:hypothetical protein
VKHKAVSSWDSIWEIIERLPFRNGNYEPVFYGTTEEMHLFYGMTPARDKP